MSLLKTNEIQNYNGSSLTLTASTVSTSAQLNTGGNISVTGSLNVSDDSTTRTNLGLGTMATQNANAVAITGGTINTVQPAAGQSLTIKDEDGNTAITVGTDNTAHTYLSLNFGSYHGDSGGAGSGTLSGNILDDYEEGTWTPAYTFSSGSVTVVIQSAKYTKVGNVVIAQCRIYTSSISSPSGNTLLNGLPFTGSSSGAIMSGMVSEMGSWATSMPDVKCSVPANTTSIELQKNATSANITALQGSDFSSGDPKNVLGLTVVYYV